jgi:hypothetical protein
MNGNYLHIIGSITTEEQSATVRSIAEFQYNQSHEPSGYGYAMKDDKVDITRKFYTSEDINAMFDDATHILHIQE